MYVLKTPLKITSFLLLVGSASFFLTGCPSGADLEDDDRFPGNSSGSGGSGTGGTSAAGSGGSSTGSGGSTPADCAQCDVEGVLKKSCLGFGCHGADAPMGGGLDLETPGYEKLLLNVPAWQKRDEEVIDPEKCDLTELRVDPNDPAKSVLVEKINGTMSCGTRMPPTKFPQENIDCLTRWAFCLAGKDPSGASGGGTDAGAGGTGTGGAAGMGTAGTGGTGAGGTFGTGG